MSVLAPPKAGRERVGEVGGEDRWPGSGGWDIFKFKVEEYTLIC